MISHYLVQTLYTLYSVIKKHLVCGGPISVHQRILMLEKQMEHAVDNFSKDLINLNIVNIHSLASQLHMSM